MRPIAPSQEARYWKEEYQMAESCVKDALQMIATAQKNIAPGNRASEMLNEVVEHLAEILTHKWSEEQNLCNCYIEVKSFYRGGREVKGHIRWLDGYDQHICNTSSNTASNRTKNL